MKSWVSSCADGLVFTRWEETGNAYCSLYPTSFLTCPGIEIFQFVCSLSLSWARQASIVLCTDSINHYTLTLCHLQVDHSYDNMHTHVINRVLNTLHPSQINTVRTLDGLVTASVAGISSWHLRRHHSRRSM